MLAYIWVAVGGAGIVFALLVLREVLADWRAALVGRASPPARAFLRETLRATWYRLGCLVVLVAAGVAPAAIPVGQRPGWVRQVAIWGLIAGEVILVVDTMLSWRAKRRYLAQYAPAQAKHRRSG